MAPSDTPATFESFQAELARLVAQFDRQHPGYTTPDYLEASLRADFLDPFFRALGWDVGNQKGLIHTEREVAIEVRTHLSGKQTRADYVFRHARTERFTCEAKKPAEVLHNRHILQAKKDAFARGVPLALLSDFEELKIYVVGARPLLDEPHVGEWKVLHFKQYPAAARELWDLLAYENVSTGSIDRLIESLPKRPLRLQGRQGYLIKPDRTRALDADFLNFLDGVRQQLGSDLLKHNDRADLLEGHRLNEAAQRIIDRLVFLRICEDRGIDTGTLLQTLFDGWYRQQPEAAKPKLRQPGKQTRLRFGGADEEPPAAGYGARGRTEGGLYRELTDHIRALDQRPPSYKPFFNGQLFKPHFSEELTVGDEWLANFLLDLVDDDNGYNFADIKVEILGDAYERFLGKILRPQGRGATIEEKPEVRKAGGVYYTPRYITDYIVEQTVGRLLAGRTPKQAEKLRIVDPACGSGSFLLRAYEEVMAHHLRWFTAHPDKRRPEDCYVDAAGDVRLTTALKRRILGNNIHGVDIDAQAVEVTQLSLYLKMLEGENRETLRNQTELFKQEPLLPPLDKNIKCFNSLIASDFSLDPAELVRVNAGDWDVQFPEIMAAGGFDAVVGNPPYLGGREWKEENGRAYEYFIERYEVAAYQFDIYALFIERALKLAVKKGMVGFITPNTWLNNKSCEKLRRFLLRESEIDSIADYSRENVFPDAVVLPIVTILRREKPKGADVRILKPIGNIPQPVHSIRQTTWAADAAQIFNIDLREDEALVRDKIVAKAQKLSAVAEVKFGIKIYETGRGTPPQKASDATQHVFESNSKIDASYRRYLEGKDVDPYLTKWQGRWLKYGANLAAPRDPTLFKGERLVFRRIVGVRLIGTILTEDYVTSQLLQIVRPTADLSARFLLGMLNSTATAFVFRKTYNRTDKAFPEIRVYELESLPVPRLDLTQKTDRSTHDRLVALVDKMLTLTPALRAAKADAEKAALQNALTKTDREIDQLVYQLYGLTPGEIALVEGAGAGASV